jgi:hypothetical protein
VRAPTLFVCAAVLAGCSGGSADGRTYEAADVVRAFRAAGISLRSEPLDQNDPCASYAFTTTGIGGVNRSEWECVYVGPEEGREMLPSAVLWNSSEKENWNIWIYPSDEIAEGVVNNPANSSFRRPPVRYTREGNVVVGYLRPEDEQRLEDALSRL